MHRTHSRTGLAGQPELASDHLFGGVRSRRNHSRALTGALLLALMTTFAGTGFAAKRAPKASPQGIVSPANCTVPSHINLVGMKLGVADPRGAFTVVVRDLGNNPMPGLTVELDVTNQPDLLLSTIQPFPGMTAISCFKASVVTDGLGSATFTVVGNASGRFLYPSETGAGAAIRAAGTLLANPTVGAYDQDGTGGCDGNDYNLVLQDFASGLNQPRSDLDGSGSVGANDISFLLIAQSAGDSNESGTGCVAPGVPDQAIEGGILLGWGDCRSSSNRDLTFACNTNAGALFHLVGALQPVVTIPDANGLEAVLDVVSLSGPLPDWWKFQSQAPAGCRVASLGSQDPSVNAAITCLSVSASQTNASAVYPFDGDPAVQRIIVNTTFGGMIQMDPGSPIAVLDVTMNRLKTTGPGSCAGCTAPVKVILRSISVIRGDPNLPASERPPAVEFTQPGGSVVRWQSTTPLFPITIDATAIAGLAPTFKINTGSCLSASSPQVQALSEGANQLQTCSSSCPSADASPVVFGVDANGKVVYAPELEGALTGAGTTTLVVKSVVFPPPGDDETRSMGQFRLVVEPKFWTLMAGYPGYGIVNGLHRLISPRLIDNATRIGRSSRITDGGAQDQGGVPVGTAETIVADTTFDFIPPGFTGPVGTPEVHTEIRSLNMTAFGGVAVRAGTFAPDQPISAGEIQAVIGATGLFPANSFFDVYVEVDLPILGTLYNSEPLVVENSDIDCFPPTVVYLHRHTGPVIVRFKADDTQFPKRWLAGEPFGWLVLAGHGVNLDGFPAPAGGRTASPRATSSAEDSLDAALAAEPEMADAATLVVDVHDAVTHAPALSFAHPQYRDSLNLGIDQAAALGQAGQPCAALIETERLYVRVDSLSNFQDWVTAPDLRRVLVNRLDDLRDEYRAQATQSGGCNLDVSTELPKKFALLGIQPNPTSGSSTIRYALASASRVSIAVYDVSGRHVRTLVDADLKAGTYQAIWDGHQDRASGKMANSGTYFIKYSAAGHSETRRVVIVR